MKILHFLVLAVFLPVVANTGENKISNLEFERIITLKQEFSEGIYENYFDKKYGEFVSDASIQLVMEEQLHVIADGISLGLKLYDLTDNKKQKFVSTTLYSAYKELDSETKYELVPLFLNEKNRETSYYFDDPTIQALALGIYMSFLNRDGITVETVEQDFLEYTPLFNKYPYLTGELDDYLSKK